MIALTRPSNTDSIIITGNKSMELYTSLRRRGFCAVATPATCPVARRRHAIGLITGQNLLAGIAQVSPFLRTKAAVAILIESREGELCMKIRQRLQQMGFRIEAGLRCRQGLVLSACRLGFEQIENAA
jgi:hypothetical protein